MEFILFLIGITVTCYVIAKRKNRNTGAAVLTGFFFGIFALIYYLAVGEKK